MCTIHSTWYPNWHHHETHHANNILITNRQAHTHTQTHVYDKLVFTLCVPHVPLSSLLVSGVEQSIEDDNSQCMNCHSGCSFRVRMMMIIQTISEIVRWTFWCFTQEKERTMNAATTVLSSYGNNKTFTRKSLNSMFYSYFCCDFRLLLPIFSAFNVCLKWNWHLMLAKIGIKCHILTLNDWTIIRLIIKMQTNDYWPIFPVKAPLTRLIIILSIEMDVLDLHHPSINRSTYYDGAVCVRVRVIKMKWGLFNEQQQNTSNNAWTTNQNSFGITEKLWPTLKKVKCSLDDSFCCSL